MKSDKKGRKKGAYVLGRCNSQASKEALLLSENDKKSYTLKERIRCSENRVKTNSVFKRKVKIQVVKLALRVRVQAIYHTFVLSSLYAVSLYVSMKSAF